MKDCKKLYDQNRYDPMDVIYGWKELSLSFRYDTIRSFEKVLQSLKNLMGPPWRARQPKLEAELLYVEHLLLADESLEISDRDKKRARLAEDVIKFSKDPETRKAWNRRILMVAEKLQLGETQVELAQEDIEYELRKIVKEYLETREGQVIFVTGDCGIGKSRGMIKVMGELLKDRPDDRFLYVIQNFKIMEDPWRKDEFPKPYSIIKSRYLMCPKYKGLGLAEFYDKCKAFRCSEWSVCQSRKNFHGTEKHWAVAHSRVPFLDISPFSIICIDEFPGMLLYTEISPEDRKLIERMFVSTEKLFLGIEQTGLQLLKTRKEMRISKRTPLRGSEIFDLMDEEGVLRRWEIKKAWFEPEPKEWENPIVGATIKALVYRLEELLIEFDQNNRMYIRIPYSLFKEVQIEMLRKDRLIFVLDGHWQHRKKLDFDVVLDYRDIRKQMEIEIVKDRAFGKTTLLMNKETRKTYFQLVEAELVADPTRPTIVVATKEIYKLMTKESEIFSGKYNVKNVVPYDFYLGIGRNIDKFFQEGVTQVILAGSYRLGPHEKYMNPEDVLIQTVGELWQCLNRLRPQRVKEPIRVVSLTNQLLQWPEATKYIKWDKSGTYMERLERFGIETAAVTRWKEGEKVKTAVAEGRGFSTHDLKKMSRKQRKDALMPVILTGIGYKEFYERYGGVIGRKTFFCWKKESPSKNTGSATK